MKLSCQDTPFHNSIPEQHIDGLLQTTPNLTFFCFLQNQSSPVSFQLVEKAAHLKIIQTTLYYIASAKSKQNSRLGTFQCVASHIYLPVYIHVLTNALTHNHVCIHDCPAKHVQNVKNRKKSIAL